MTGLIAATALVAALILLALHREWKRIQQRNRMREFLRTNEQAREFQRRMVRLTIEIQDRFTPAMQQLARACAEMAPTFDKVGQALRDAELKRANAYRKGRNDNQGDA